jgi:hypothetical protein
MTTPRPFIRGGLLGFPVQIFDEDNGHGEEDSTAGVDCVHESSCLVYLLADLPCPDLSCIGASVSPSHRRLAQCCKRTVGNGMKKHGEAEIQLLRRGICGSGTKS